MRTEPDPGSGSFDVPTTLYTYGFEHGQQTVVTNLFAEDNHTASDPISLPAPAGRLTKQVYNADGSLADSFTWEEVTDASGQTSAAAYTNLEARLYDSETGRLKTVIDADGFGTDYEYHDALGLVRKVVKPNGETVQYEYDSAGNRTRLVYTGNPAKGSGDTRWSYDALSRPVEMTVDKITSSSGSASGLANRTWTYEGHKTTYKDRNGIEHTIEFDPVNGATTTDAVDSANSYDYSRTETVATNGLLQRVQEELKISGSSYYKSDFTYDLDQSDSETETVKDLVFGTDQLDHVWTDTLDDRGQIDLHKFAFEGNETSATQLWSDDFDFDYLGRVTDLSRSIDTISGPVAAIWSGSSKPADKSVAYRYNVDGTRQSLERSESGSVLTSSVYDYTAAGRTKKIEHGTGTVNPTTNQLTGGNLLGSHEYGYDAVGRLIVQADTYEDGAGTELRDIDRVFAYDQAGQLLKVTETVDGGTPTTRDYTDGRSSTSTAWNASSDNRLKQDDTYDYEYDLEGRMKKRTSRLSPSIGAYDTFHWDPAGRLITVKQYNTSSVLVATIEYGYGADGLMSGRRVTDGSSNVQSETGYIHEGLQRVAELDLTGTDPVITELYLHGAQPNEIVATDVDTGSGYTSVWGFTDALGSLTTVASQDGSDWDVVHNVTTEYGGNRDQFGDTAGNDHLTSAKVWAGHYIDPDTGLIEAKARWYDPISGRFISQDPIGFSAGDANLYRYVSNSPGNAVDPDGMDELAVNRRKGLQDGSLSVIKGFRGHEYVVGNNLASKAAGYFGTLFWDRGLASGPHLRPQDRPRNIGERAFGPVGDAIRLDTEANRHRYDQRGPDAPGTLSAGGKFHVSEGTTFGLKAAASYPIVIATIATPGPEDAIGLFVSRYLASRGMRVVSEAGEWVIRSDSGDVVARGDDAVKDYIRTEVPAPQETIRRRKNGQFAKKPGPKPQKPVYTDAQRQADWKRLADDPNSGLSAAERAQIKARGNRGPQRLNEHGELETMELSHEPIPLRDGGTNVVPRWPADHAAIDPHRHLKKRN